MYSLIYLLIIIAIVVAQTASQKKKRNAARGSSTAGTLGKLPSTPPFTLDSLPAELFEFAEELGVYDQIEATESHHRNEYSASEAIYSNAIDSIEYSDDSGESLLQQQSLYDTPTIKEHTVEEDLDDSVEGEEFQLDPINFILYSAVAEPKYKD